MVRNRSGRAETRFCLAETRPDLVRASPNNADDVPTIDRTPNNDLRTPAETGEKPAELPGNDLHFAESTPTLRQRRNNPLRITEFNARRAAAEAERPRNEAEGNDRINRIQHWKR